MQRGDSTEEIARSPKFRWRESSAAPPESPETATCLETLEHALAGAGWERVDGSGGEWCARQFRRQVVPLNERLSAYAITPDESMIAWLNAQTAAPAREESDARGDDSARGAAIREAARRRELEQLEAERREAERLLLRHRELERLEAERREQERLQAESQELGAQELEAEHGVASTLRGRLGAYTGTVEPQADIRASFGAKAARDSPG